MSYGIQKEYPDNDVKEVLWEGETYRLVSESQVKGKYSISMKYYDIFILKDLFDLDNPIVWREVEEITLLYKKLYKDMLDNGVKAKSAAPRAKKEAFERIQAKLIDEIGKKAYFKIFPMCDKSKAKTTKQRKNEQVREVKSKIKEIKTLTKELNLPPEVVEQPTKTELEIIQQVNEIIQDDKSLEALKDTRDLEELKKEKAKIEIPDIQLDIDIKFGEVNSDNKTKKVEVEIPSVPNEVQEDVLQQDKSNAEVEVIEMDDNMLDFFFNDDLF